MHTTERFEGYGVLITGAARGIGAATARRLAEEGARVLVTDVDLPAAERSVTELRGQGLAVEAYRCDVGDRESVEAAVAHAVSVFGSFDVLVNNAFGCTPDEPLFENTPDETWARDLDLTLTSAFRCSRAALPHLVASGRGAIVNIGSVNGLQDFGNHAYSAGKAGLVSLTRTLAGDAAPRGVRVNLVAPGTIRTPGWAGRESHLDDLAGIYPLGRVGEPSDIAAAVAFLASRDAAWITGTTLRVDGGLLAVNTSFERVARAWREAENEA
ncbi:SDR family NAD(P)-dependent oxidoreductase [Streptomyces stelliscabiei]|uniref:SDR family NAD(P)-dependent oxidoreductase n=1 Tax=Streptomyces stelliscabiei TaxID=146820 RepID=UPI0029AECD95|nr:SDR family NAD(P)-dependent oxidoreductase [Streptomyces stelliscabiei]MDX2552380.1 SDR family NAD(P)-dependent oxidoreductase [Streptomyces stelliscabiei]MDX2611775.1 SDR family NAD(P)-dependent oxidoreductase [Streptomyces stelliscabiei]MDX2637124.1 SDR family NAD(P)-dependent oxidoreductase [Streptomyces stelliscabiei]MDX2660541.1 SDR family NAD(P)-dependent oxidoreductase [Streptomyces stelliscabiei]MDX2714717.1 SDR family NAD(P)-dependent oxidoreductase [Streptomyces stelliscabiei]